MEPIDEFVAVMQARLDKTFGLAFEAVRDWDRMKVRCLDGESISATSIRFICGFYADFISCYWDGRHLWAIFDVSRCYDLK